MANIHEAEKIKLRDFQVAPDPFPFEIGVGPQILDKRLLEATSVNPQDVIYEGKFDGGGPQGTVTSGGSGAETVVYAFSETRDPLEGVKANLEQLAVLEALPGMLDNFQALEGQEKTELAKKILTAVGNQCRKDKNYPDAIAANIDKQYREPLNGIFREKAVEDMAGVVDDPDKKYTQAVRQAYRSIMLYRTLLQAQYYHDHAEMNPAWRGFIFNEAWNGRYQAMTLEALALMIARHPKEIAEYGLWLLNLYLKYRGIPVPEPDPTTSTHPVCDS